MWYFSRIFQKCFQWFLFSFLTTTHKLIVQIGLSSFQKLWSLFQNPFLWFTPFHQIVCTISLFPCWKITIVKNIIVYHCHFLYFLLSDSKSTTFFFNFIFLIMIVSDSPQFSQIIHFVLSIHQLRSLIFHCFLLFFHQIKLFFLKKHQFSVLVPIFLEFNFKPFQVEYFQWWYFIFNYFLFSFQLHDLNRSQILQHSRFSFI